jgi:hypothetical protein
MRARLVIALVLGSLGGTGGCKQSKAPTPASELLDKVRALSAKACACKDRACVEPLLVEWNALTNAIGGSGAVSGGTFTEEQVEGLATEDERFMKCAGSFAPPAPAPAPASAPAAGN